MKLSGWRTQSYRIRILVDDRVVFAGSTQRSLGYVTFDFPTVMGKSLKVELTGSANNRDAFGNIVRDTRRLTRSPLPARAMRRACSVLSR